MTYQPDLYDVVTAPTMQNDVEWYCRKAQQSGGPVLELGAGTGRITLGIARDGVAIHALDAHPPMLGALRRKLEAKAHLGPSGRFAFNVFHPSLTYMAANSGPLAGVWRQTSVSEKPDGGSLVRSESSSYDTVRQIVHSLHRFEEYGADGTLVRTSLHRLELAYLYEGDLRRLLGLAGFQSIEIAGAFDGRPLASDTDERVVEAW
jgi:SAM-dependent methyltransferase